MFVDWDSEEKQWVIIMQNGDRLLYDGTKTYEQALVILDKLVEDEETLFDEA
jgi:hypothetical protein